MVICNPPVLPLVSALFMYLVSASKTVAFICVDDSVVSILWTQEAVRKWDNFTFNKPAELAQGFKRDN